MRPFRFPSVPKTRSLIKYHSLEDGDDRLSNYGYDRRRELSVFRLIALTCSAGGLQVVLSLIMSNGTPFLITIGLPESLTAVVWVVAPLSGVFVQPYVGLLSDQCQLSWGRRRPFILAGAVGCVFCMLGLASSKTVIHGIASALGANPFSTISRGFVLMSAILFLFGLYIFIQPLQAGIRSLIVDSCPTQQQIIASAWASRLTGVGNIIGYLFGFVPVRRLFPSLNISQFAWLCLVASLVLSLTVISTCHFIKEQDPRTLPSTVSEKRSFLGTIKHILWSAKTMPKKIQDVCVVQFFAWLGWFPYLFYISSYVGDLYAAPLLAKDISSSGQALIIEDAVRLGSLASLVFSIFALVTNMLIPSLIKDESKHVSSLSHPLRRITMTRAWSLSHLLFSFTLLSTLLPQTQTTATIIASVIGISWAFTLWVPFALIGREIAARQELNAKVLEGELEMEPLRQDQAGSIMGLHNCAISAPQILAALVCGSIFWICPKIGVQDSIGWVLRFGSVGGFIASALAARMDA
ncbi:hypothetical protein, variant [Verruconis gallopava]|nr:hypothetical protein, variant [Verruconis gallopava]KIW09335.1 hypothetical protein, variant [Verruconis gallopava]